MFDEQLARIPIDQVTYVKMAEALNQTIDLIDAANLNQEEGMAATLGVLTATLLLLLKKLDAQGGKFQHEG